MNFLGAIKALRDPITKEILCSLIDQHMRHNMANQKNEQEGFNVT
jgi:hypothetical protein